VAAAPAPLLGATAAAPKPDQGRRHDHPRRRHRYRHLASSRKGKAVQVALLAALLGIGTGLAAHSCSSETAQAAP